MPFSAPVVRHRVTLQQVRSTLCSKQKSTSSPLCRVLTFRRVSTPLGICTYAQLPQARETRQTCRKACVALEQKPYRKSASVWFSAYFPRPGLRIRQKQRRLSVLQPTSVHRHPEADPLRKESQRSQRQSRSLGQTMHTDISAPVLKFCAQKTSRITGRSYPRAGGNHIGATLEFSFVTRWGDILFEHCKCLLLLSLRCPPIYGPLFPLMFSRKGNATAVM